MDAGAQTFLVYVHCQCCGLLKIYSVHLVLHFVIYYWRTQKPCLELDSFFRFNYGLHLEVVQVRVSRLFSVNRVIPHE